MRLLIPAHYGIINGGIGTLASGLLDAVRDAVRPPDELVVPPLPHGRGLRRELVRIGSGLGGFARLRYEQFVLSREARRVDVVHLLDARPLLASRSPFVLSVHDVSYLDHPDWFSPSAAFYKRSMLAAALRKRPAAIVFDTSFGRERLLYHHPEAEQFASHIVHPGLNPAPPVRIRRDEEPYMLTVAAIEPRKNHLGLLGAFRNARRRGFRLRWKVVGPPGHRAEPILAALRAQDGVDVLGMVSQAELETAYAGAVFLASPSHLEGFGYPPLEAMARGVPVLCSTGHAYDETVGGVALQAPAEDEEEWAQSLLRLAEDDSLRERMRAKGEAHAATFSWARAADELLEIYARAAGLRAGSVSGSVQ